MLSGRLVVILVLAAACVIGPGSSSTAPENPSQTSWPPAATIAIKFFSPSAGWSIAGGRLLLTTDAGRTWTDRTPPNVTDLTDRRVYWLDPTHAWVSQETHATELAVLRTTDAGRTWSAGVVSVGNETVPESIRFRDANDGWLVETIPASSAHRAAEVYRTADGGRTWRRLPVPTGGALWFAGSSDGWLTGGPAYNELFRTQDDGMTWQAQSLDLPPLVPSGFKLTGVLLPTLLNASDGVLPAKYGDSTGLDPTAYVDLYWTHDRGRSWVPTSPIEQRPDPGYLASSSVAIIDNGHWIVAAGERLFSTSDGGVTWKALSPDWYRLDPVGGAVSDRVFLSVSALSFIDPWRGFGILESQHCPGVRQACTVATVIVRTSDGGNRWTR